MKAITAGSPSIRRSVAAAAGSVLVGSMLLAGAPAAEAAVVVGRDVNLYGLCRYLRYDNVRITNPANPYAWQCITGNRARAIGWGDINNWCRVQYGPSAFTGLAVNNAYGWRCYR